MDGDQIIVDVCKAMHPQLEAIVHQYCDEAYAAIMESVQDHLVDNAQYNIGQRTLSAEAENKRLNLRNYQLNQDHKALLAALTAIVEFCDDPDGSDKGPSLALGLCGLLPAARAAIAKASSGDSQ